MGLYIEASRHLWLLLSGNYVHVLCYDYRETRIKTVLNTSADGSLLTYNQSRIFNFSPETSGAGLRETDTICTINIPLVVSAFTKASHMSCLTDEHERGVGKREGERERERERERETETERRGARATPAWEHFNKHAIAKLLVS